MDFTMFGPGIVLGLGCIGSAIGCGIAGMASHGVMTHVEEGHGNFIGLSAMPSSQSIYGFVLMIRMKAAIVGGGLSSMLAVATAFPWYIADAIIARPAKRAMPTADIGDNPPPIIAPFILIIKTKPYID